MITKSKLGEKGLFGLHVPNHRLPRKVRAGTEAWLEPGGRSDAEAVEGANWFVSRGLLSLLSCRTQDHQPRSGTPTVG